MPVLALRPPRRKSPLITEADAARACPQQGFLFNYVLHAMKQTTSPLAYHIGVGLSILAATCPSTYGMRYAGILRPNMYTLLVGRSGEDQKSSALGIGKDILFEAAAALVGDFPGSAEGLIESLDRQNTQLIPVSEFGKLLAAAQRGYFEPIKTLLTDTWDCLDADTQVLGEDGWKSREQLAPGDLVYTLNRTTGTMEFVPVDAVNRRLVYEGEEMVSIVLPSGGVMRVTEGHDLYFLNPEGEYEKVKGRHALLVPGDWRLPVLAAGGEIQFLSVSDLSISLSPARDGETVWCLSNRNGTLVARRGSSGPVVMGNCTPQQRAKANNKIIRVDNPRLSVMGGCSVPYLEKHTLAEDWTGGFMGRWFVIHAQRERVDPDPVGDDTMKPWLVDELKRRAYIPSAGDVLGLTPTAKQLWADWFTEVSSRQLPGNIVGIRSRAPTIARKIAMLLGWDFGGAIAGQPWYMDVDVLVPAIAITELHIRSLIDLAEVIAEHPDARARRSVLDAIRLSGGEATLGQILAVMKSKRRPVMESLDAIMEEGRVVRYDTALGPVYRIL